MKKLKTNVLLIMVIWILIMVLAGVYLYKTEENDKKITVLENKIIALQLALDTKNDTIKSLNSEINTLQIKLNSRNWKDHYTKELLIKMVDNNKQAYYTRNEIMYYNKDMSRVEASYQALWIYTWSIENRVNPYLTTAVFVQESKLRHIDIKGDITTSGAGARGIGQLMPIVERIYDVDATIFEENVKGTTLFLNDLQNMYDGDLKGMLGHYNGGSRPYEKIRDYTETREFVEKVTHIYESMIDKY